MAIGAVVLVGAGVALLIKAARNRGTSTSGGAAPGGANPYTQKLLVDSTLLAVNPATTDSLAAKKVRDGLALRPIQNAAVSALLSAASSIATTFGVAILTVMVSNPYTFIIAAIIAIIVSLVVLGALKDARGRFRLKMQMVAGDCRRLNAYELSTVGSWLKQMGVSYTVTNVTDYRQDVYYTIDRDKMVSHADRYAIINVTALSTKDWISLQVLARLASLDYFQRIGTLMGYMSAYWWDGPPAVMPYIRPWATAQFPYLWTLYPLIGDSTPVADDLDADKPTILTASRVFANPTDAMGFWSQTPVYAQVQLNNHWMAIMTALGVTKFDEADFPAGSEPAYAAKVYRTLGLSFAADRISLEAGSTKYNFDIDYWGRTTIVDVAAVRRGQNGSVAILNDSGHFVSTQLK